MPWEVEYTDQFEAWWNALDESEQESVAVGVRLLEAKGPTLQYPYSLVRAKCSDRRQNIR